MSESAIEKLTRISGESADRAGEALSKLLRQPIRMILQGANFEPIEAVPTYLATQPGLSVCLLSRVQGELEGNALLAFSLPAARTWVGLLGGEFQASKDDSMPSIGPMEQSMLEETANIALSSFMNGFAQSLGLTAVPTSPIFLLDMAESIGSLVLMECAEVSDQTFLFRVDFRIGDQVLDATLAFLPSPHALAEFSLV